MSKQRLITKQAQYRGGDGSKVEEKCPNCKRMKDVGEPCWFCGSDNPKKTPRGLDLTKPSYGDRRGLEDIQKTYKPQLDALERKKIKIRDPWEKFSALRPIDVWAQASTIYTNAMSSMGNNQVVFDASKKLYELSKAPEIDKNTASEIARLAAELQEMVNANTAQSGGGSIGQGGMSQSGMPTGLTIQGTFKQYRRKLIAKAVETIKLAGAPKLSDKVWVMLLAEAIKSFDQGLESRVDYEGRRAQVDYDAGKATLCECGGKYGPDGVCDDCGRHRPRRELDRKFTRGKGLTKDPEKLVEYLYSGKPSGEGEELHIKSFIENAIGKRALRVITYAVIAHRTARQVMQYNA